MDGESTVETQAREAGRIPTSYLIIFISISSIAPLNVQTTVSLNFGQDGAFNVSSNQRK